MATRRAQHAGKPVSKKRGKVPASYRYVRRDASGRTLPMASRSTLTGRRAVIRTHGVTISGPVSAVEDFLGGHEIDRRLADPANDPPIPWGEARERWGV